MTRADRTPAAPPAKRAGFRPEAADLLEQQCWCWGRDIARPEGNVLLDLGFCRYRAPDPRRGSTAYTAGAPAGGAVWLWGFGVALAEPGAGSVFVRRYDFAPRLTRSEAFPRVHDPDQIPGLFRPASARDWQLARRLLAALAKWVAGYEHWVAENLGRDYRERCLAARPKPATVPAADMPAAWERLAKRCRRMSASAGAEIAGPWGGILGRLRAEAALGGRGAA